MRNSDVLILVVEDSAYQADCLRDILEQQGYRVAIAGNGMEALEFLSREIPDLIISDIIMPEMDGYQLCKSIKADEHFRHIPVVLLTALDGTEDIIRGLQCMADNFITKPYEEESLLSRINDILLDRKMRSEEEPAIGTEIVVGGEKYVITSSRVQILGLLLSTYENVARKNRELEQVNRELKKANETISTIHGLIPICAQCKKIRVDKGAWQQIEQYIHERSNAKFTHGICPECAKSLYPEHYDNLNFDKG
ncbi:MAG: response regulator [Nitrospirae bacterium]|nr:response regulator [Nitrospirota bacterium]